MEMEKINKLMQSDDEIDQLKGEYLYLEQRLYYIQIVENDGKAGNMNPLLICPLSALQFQIKSMAEYKAMLECRLSILGVNPYAES